MRIRWQHLRDPDTALDVIHAVYGGPYRTPRVVGTIMRCNAPHVTRARCGRFAYTTLTRPTPTRSVAHICTNHHRECDHRRQSSWESPPLSLPVRSTHLSASMRTWVRRVVSEATGIDNQTLAAASAFMVAPIGSDQEREALGVLDAMCGGRDELTRLVWRQKAQERLAEHLAKRTRREHPERKEARR